MSSSVTQVFHDEDYITARNNVKSSIRGQYKMALMQDDFGESFTEYGETLGTSLALLNVL